jgi:hypothetical protein
MSVPMAPAMATMRWKSQAGAEPVWSGNSAVLRDIYPFLQPWTMWLEIRNPRHKIRNKFETRKRKLETSLAFRISNFGFVSNFDIRASNFWFRYSCFEFLGKSQGTIAAGITTGYSTINVKTPPACLAGEKNISAELRRRAAKRHGMWITTGEPR